MYILDYQKQIDLFGLKGSYSFILDDKSHEIQAKSEMTGIFAQYVVEHNMDSCTFEVLEGGTEEYFHIRGNGESKVLNSRREVRKVLVNESNGAWVEKVGEVYHYFVGNPTRMIMGIKEDEDAFFKKIQLTKEQFLQRYSSSNQVEQVRKSTVFEPLLVNQENGYDHMPNVDERPVLPTFMNPLAQELLQNDYQALPSKQPPSISNHEDFKGYTDLPGGKVLPTFTSMKYSVSLEELDWNDLYKGKTLHVRLTLDSEGNPVLRRVDDFDPNKSENDALPANPKTPVKSVPVPSGGKLMVKTDEYTTLPKKPVEMPLSAGEFDTNPKTPVKSVTEPLGGKLVFKTHEYTPLPKKPVEMSLSTDEFDTNPKTPVKSVPAPKIGKLVFKTHEYTTLPKKTDQ